jgi:hypothetical protein
MLGGAFGARLPSPPKLLLAPLGLRRLLRR